MVINFNRVRTQKELEKIVDNNYDIETATSQEKKLFSQSIEAYILTQLDVAKLSAKIQLDAIDYFYNGCVSLMEGIKNIDNQHFSWGAIQLYYSLFYFCRSKLAFSNYCLFRTSNNLYLWEIKCNALAKKASAKKSNSTHGGTFHFFKKTFPDIYILSNNVDGYDVFEWFKNIREIVNYRAVKFYEPNYLGVFDNFNNHEKLISNIHKIMNDQSGIIFQKEYAIVGIPLRLLMYLLSTTGINEDTLSEEQQLYLGQLLDSEIKELFLKLKTS